MANIGGGGQQILILPEGTQRLLGREAQRMNIMAGKALAESIRTTLGRWSRRHCCNQRWCNHT